MANYVGTINDDSLSGTEFPDSFDMSQGGDDTVLGGDGADTIQMGGAFTAADRIDGGDSFDTVTLSGRYKDPIVLQADTLVSVEDIELTGRRITLVIDADTIADGKTLYVAGNGATRVTIDGSAETSSNMSLAGGSGDDVLIAGGGNDFLFLDAGGEDRASGGVGHNDFWCGGGLSAGDRITGGADFDAISCNAGPGALTLTRVSGVESMTPSAGAAGIFSLTVGNAIATPDQSFSFNSPFMGATRLNFDGSAERDGKLVVYGTDGDDTMVGGRAGDSLSGGGGGDLLIGGSGADSLFGGAGPDVFRFVALSDSTKNRPDLIQDLSNADDIIDLSAIDADANTSGDQAFHFVEAFTGAAAEAVISNFGGVSHLMLDVDGDAKADMVITTGSDFGAFAGWVL